VRVHSIRRLCHCSLVVASAPVGGDEKTTESDFLDSTPEDYMRHVSRCRRKSAAGLTVVVGVSVVIWRYLASEDLAFVVIADASIEIDEFEHAVTGPATVG